MFTFPQVRARLVGAALRQLGRDGIVKRLSELGCPLELLDTGASTRALAWRLAWCLLPARGFMSSWLELFQAVNAVPNGTDTRTGQKGGLNVR
jgi:hypothetical protein